MIITTSKILESKDIDERLKDESFVSSICDDKFQNKRGTTYLVKSGKYKLEFYFSKDSNFIFFMVEQYNKHTVENEYLSFLDDIAIFSDKDFVRKHLHENVELEHGCVTSDNIEYYYTDGMLDSLYVLKS